jgi:DNA invertase Pin-like site-specific DNA recombinase
MRRATAKKAFSPLQTLPGRQIGYARVSTDEQSTDSQHSELMAAGCDMVIREHGSGASRGRLELARLMQEIRPGDVLVVVRLDRLARSVSHLLDTIERLEARGAHFRSLRDPIDTSTPQGMFSLQVLGAVAQLERALISERTKAGIKTAQSNGKRSGNPGLRERHPDALHKISVARDQHHLSSLLATLDAWLPTVRQMRPDHSWADVAQVLNRKNPGSDWTRKRLSRAVHRVVREHLAEPHLIERTRAKSSQDRLLTLVSGISRANPEMGLLEIGAQLEAMRERTPRGGHHWSASSVKNLLDQGKKLGLIRSDESTGMT